MPYDNEADRELVQQTFSREWGEPICVVRVEEFNPGFEVPGRQADGSPSSEHRVRQFCYAAFRFLYFLVAFALSAISNANVGDPRSFASYRGHVRGSEGSSGVQFAELLRGESFWLVLSESGLAAVKTGSSPQVTVIWSAVGPDRPQRDGDDAGILRWPDGSWVYVILDPAESQRLAGV